MTSDKDKSRRKYHLVDEDSPFALREAYKAARTNLMFLLKNSEDAKAVVFTSPLMTDGKTITCVNMGITFANAGARVIIIDADMRKPQIHKIMDLPTEDGLSDVLLDIKAIKNIKKTHINNLRIMTAGTIPPNPTELLMSDMLGELLESLNEYFDYIFFDTPPVGLVTDAAIIASQTMGAILVSRQGITSKPALRDAVQALEQAGAKTLAHIFNDVDYEKYSYKYSRYKYGYKYGHKYG